MACPELKRAVSSCHLIWYQSWQIVTMCHCLRPQSHKLPTHPTHASHCLKPSGRGCGGVAVLQVAKMNEEIVPTLLSFTASPLSAPSPSPLYSFFMMPLSIFFFISLLHLRYLTQGITYSHERPCQGYGMVLWRLETMLARVAADTGVCKHACHLLVFTSTLGVEEGINSNGGRGQADGWQPQGKRELSFKKEHF